MLGRRNCFPYVNTIFERAMGELMKNMKKIICLLSVIVICFLLSACNALPVYLFKDVDVLEYKLKNSMEVQNVE